jgi:hypothetical protein
MTFLGQTTFLLTSITSSRDDPNTGDAEFGNEDRAPGLRAGDRLLFAIPSLFAFEVRRHSPFFGNDGLIKWCMEFVASRSCPAPLASGSRLAWCRRMACGKEAECASHLLECSHHETDEMYEILPVARVRTGVRICIKMRTNKTVNNCTI